MLHALLECLQHHHRTAGIWGDSLTFLGGLLFSTTCPILRSSIEPQIRVPHPSWFHREGWVIRAKREPSCISPVSNKG
jgi:hypothetical protein